MDQLTKAPPRRYDREHMDRVIINTLFVRLDLLQQRVKELEAVAVLDVFAAVES